MRVVIITIIWCLSSTIAGHRTRFRGLETWQGLRRVVVVFGEYSIIILCRGGVRPWRNTQQKNRNAAAVFRLGDDGHAMTAAAQ